MKETRTYIKLMNIKLYLIKHLLECFTDRSFLCCFDRLKIKSCTLDIKSSPFVCVLVLYFILFIFFLFSILVWIRVFFLSFYLPFFQSPSLSLLFSLCKYMVRLLFSWPLVSLKCKSVLLHPTMDQDVHRFSVTFGHYTFRSR